MTTYKSDAVNSGIMPDHAVPAGVVLSRSGEYTTTSDAIVSADTIQMVPMPKNAKVIDIKLYSGGGASVATGLELGDGDDTDRFFVNATFTGDHVYDFSSTCCNKGEACDFVFTQDDTIDIYLSKAPTKVPTSTQFIVNVLYKMIGAIDDDD
jgi:hypothetical protein